MALSIGSLSCADPLLCVFPAWPFSSIRPLLCEGSRFSGLACFVLAIAAIQKSGRRKFQNAKRVKASKDYIILQDNELLVLKY